MAWLSHLGRVIDACSVALVRRPSVARAIVSVVLILAWTTAAGAVWFTWDLVSSTPRRDMLRRVGDMAQATTLLDLNGRAAFTIFKEQRIEVPLAKVSPLVRQAILSIEDQRFYEHNGVDTIRIANATVDQHARPVILHRERRDLVAEERAGSRAASIDDEHLIRALAGEQPAH